MPLDLILTGGQTGGLAPLGWLTEGPIDPWTGRPGPDEPHPELADFGLVECPEPGYRARTLRNVADADCVLWFGATTTPGARTTIDAARKRPVDHRIVEPGASIRPLGVAAFLTGPRFRRVMVAGNRESKAPGIGGKVERFMTDVFKRLAEFEGV